MVDSTPEDTPDALIRQARAGGEPAFGRLLSRYANYLTLLARVEVGRRLQGKLDPADLVQDTFLEAHRHFPAFRGTTEPEFAAWLRQILAGVLANTVRRYFGTKARDPRLEHDLRAGVEQSSCMLVGQFASPGTSPSEVASRREQAVLFADALGGLPDDYREVLILRHFEALTFAAVADRMGRSVDSVEKLWMRAVARLRQVVGGG
ncbi:MAG: polymerase subunit sigma-24 [Gemmataceae bacterium]|nr:polymerase subunit sigma-24 [Gemmataceae bacterium]